MTNLGQLFIVATPIGNLDDISYRAIATLKQVDKIAAEDTRHSAKLLNHFGITTQMTAFHDHNEKDKAQLLIKWLKQGLDIALISDAGTPLICDPGYAIVNLCRAEGINVIPIPGACAMIAALSCAGLPSDRFTFMGFIPQKLKARQAFFTQILEGIGTVICYESPRRILETCKAMQDVIGEDTQVVLAKEMSKTFETFYAGCLGDLIGWLAADPVHQKGEMVLLIGSKVADPELIPHAAVSLLRQLLVELPLNKAAAIVAGHYDLKKNQLYQLGLTYQSSN